MICDIRWVLDPSDRKYLENLLSSSSMKRRRAATFERIDCYACFEDSDGMYRCSPPDAVPKTRSQRTYRVDRYMAVQLI